MSRKLCPTLGTSACHCSSLPKYLTTPRCEDKHALFRVLWSNHAWYTVNFIQNALFSCIGMIEEIQAELMNNQTEIGDELGKWVLHNKQQGNEMGHLLQAHIGAAAEATMAAKNKLNQKEKTKALFDQGDQLAMRLAMFLKMKNPELLQKEFRTHNQHVLNLVGYLLTNQKTKYVTELNAYICHMMHLSDQILNII
jgi:hypothetical protein